MIHLFFRSRCFLFGLLVPITLTLASCASSRLGDGVSPANQPELMVAGSVNARASKSPERTGDQERLRIHQASQTIEVSDVAASAKQAEEVARAREGFVESSSVSSNGKSYATLTLRVPAEARRAAMDDIAGLGNETSRRTDAEDTTEAYVDLEARLKNTDALRDRLRRLLDATDSIKEILEIEKELARVQSDLDAMKARFQSMQGQVRLAKIDLTLRTKEIPGPVGAAGKGLWWSIRKLFVLK